MRRLGKFIGLSGVERLLLLRALLLVILMRAGLWLLPFPRLRRLASRLAGPLPPADGAQRPAPYPAARIAWAVAATSRFVPRATCLTQALAAHILLTRSGYPAQVYIGVAKAGRGELEAHAWVQCQGRIILGAVAPGRFATLTELTG